LVLARVRPAVPAIVLIPVLLGLTGNGHTHIPDSNTGQPLRAPAAMRNVSSSPRAVEVHLVADARKLSLRPGPATEVFAYNGTVPGPTLELREGDSVVVHFENRLDVPTTVHWHGLHIPFDADGSPFHPVGPGEKRDYVFRLRPGSAGTYWYHPHPNHSTGPQVARGLYGAIIVRAPDDPLPGAIPEKLIILSDNRFNGDGSVDLPPKGSDPWHIDEENGREGDVFFVNGQVLPTISIRKGEVQRWRIINASAARVYRLALDGQKMTHVGNDGGLFEIPREVSELTIANGERIEVLVRGSLDAGQKIALQALPYDRYIPQTRPVIWKTTRDLLTLEQTAEVAKPVSIPSKLRVVPAIDTSEADVRRVVTLSQGLINGKHMDMSRVDFTAKLDDTEIWQIENIVGMDHPFHLHGFQFQVIDRNGVPEPFRSWKDMVNVPKHETARIIVRLARYPGKWMFHCHILDHEDHGMMGILEVIKEE
jgi:FtsP/CotA-like multicopper oxidase with cupredoxin domain